MGTTFLNMGNWFGSGDAELTNDERCDMHQINPGDVDQHTELVYGNGNNTCAPYSISDDDDGSYSIDSNALLTEGNIPPPRGSEYRAQHLVEDRPMTIRRLARVSPRRTQADAIGFPEAGVMIAGLAVTLLLGRYLFRRFWEPTK